MRMTSRALVAPLKGFIIPLAFVVFGFFVFAFSALAAVQGTSQTSLQTVGPAQQVSQASLSEERIIVKFKKGVSVARVQSLMSTPAFAGVREIKGIPQLNAKVFLTPAGASADALISSFLTNPNVEYAEKDRLLSANFVPNDTWYSSQWHHPVIGTPTVWDTTRGEGVTVAVVDTGVNCSVADLSGQCVPGRNVVLDNSDTSDEHNHGTWVAGTIAAIGNNGTGVAGAAWGVKIMPIRITSGTSNTAFGSDMVDGVVWAADRGVKIVNLSFGSTDGSAPSFFITDAGSYLQSKGGVLFQSAGNQNIAMTWPDTPSVVTVGATDQGDVKASFSNYGPGIDITAPGAGIYTTGRDGNIYIVNGTSFASPLAAATAALMLSKNPSLTAAQIESILKSSARDLGVTGRDDVFGFGRISAAAAVAATPPSDTTPPSTPTGLVATNITSTSLTLSWTASTDNSGIAPTYRVFRGGVQIGTSAGTSFSDSGLTASTAYSYQVRAVDVPGNVSLLSTALSVTTTAPPPSDTTPPSVPAGLVATNITSISLTLSWTASTDNSGTAPTYRVFRGGVQIGTSAGTSFNDSGLTASTAYSYQVRAVDGSGNVSALSATLSVTTLAPPPDTTPPTKPTNLAATNITSTSLTLSWTASTDNSGIAPTYRVFRDDLQIGTATGTSFNYSNLTASTTYSLAVVAQDLSDNLAFSAQLLVTTLAPPPDTTPPSTPTGLSASSITQTSLTLSWTASTDNSGTAPTYRVFSGGVQVGTSVGTSFNDSGLTVATTYNYTVSALDGSGNVSTQSSALSVTTMPVADITPPTTPTNLRAVRVQTTSVTLLWDFATDNSGSVSYQVFRGTILVGTIADTAFTVTGLAKNTTYSFTVKAIDPSGNLSSASNTLSVRTAKTSDTSPPTTPTSLRTTSVTGSAVALAWNASTDNRTTVFYRVYRGGVIIQDNISGTAYTDSTVAAGTTYSYQVQAKDLWGNLSGISAALSVTITAPDTTPPSTPTGLSASLITQTSLTLSWTASTDNSGTAPSYRVFRGGVQVGTASGTSFNDSGLTASTAYSYQISAVDGSNNVSALSTPLSVTTASPPPPDTVPPTTPTNLQTTSIQTTSIALSWDPSTDNSGTVSYHILRNGTQVGTSNSASFTDVGLSINTLYVYQVRAVDPSGNQSGLSNQVSVTTLNQDVTPPTTPTDLRLVGLKTTSATLLWSASTDDSGSVSYQVFRGTINVGTTAGTTFTVTGLIKNTTYSFTVKAIDPSGNLSSASNTLSVRTAKTSDTSPPTTPTSLRTTSVTGSAVDLAWNASTDNRTTVFYRVYRGGVIIQDNISGTAYTDSTVAAGTTYSYQVQAKDLWGNLSGISVALSVTITAPDTTPPSTPTGLSASSITQTSLTLSWTASTDNSGTAPTYRVFRGGVQVGTASGTSFNDSGLTASTAYSYQISAVDGSNNVSALSTPLSVTTASPPPPDTTPPSTPTGLSASAVAQTSLTLSWTASTDNSGTAPSYRVFRGGVQVGTSAGASFNDSGLTASTTYSYTVSAVDGSGNTSVQSTPLSVTTSASSSTPLALGTVSAIPDANFAEINWTTNNPATGFVRYGTTSTSLNLQVNATVSQTSQLVMLSGLTLNTTYYYRVTATANGQTVVSAILSFRTSFEFI